MSDWSVQRHWEQVAVGTEIGPIAYPLSLYRLVMAAAATRDFNSIHHNSAFARRTGAPDAYANTMVLQGMWERVAREYIGLRGRIVSLCDFRMRAFAPVGFVVVVRGRLADKWLDGAAGVIELELRSEIADTTVCGPGRIVAVLPRLSTGQKGTDL